MNHSMVLGAALALRAGDGQPAFGLKAREATPRRDDYAIDWSPNAIRSSRKQPAPGEISPDFTAVAKSP